jgi:hypothetical protein
VVHPLSLLYDSCTGLHYLPYLCDKPFIRSSQAAYRNRQHSDSRSKKRQIYGVCRCGRGEDVLLLADYFLQRYTHKYKKEINGLSREAKQKLMRYHWPGNVRELQHAIERAIILSDSPLLKPANFMLQPQPEKRVNTDEILNLEQLERNAIERAMKRSEGNLSRAAII